MWFLLAIEAGDETHDLVGDAECGVIEEFGCCGYWELDFGEVFGLLSGALTDVLVLLWGEGGFVVVFHFLYFVFKYKINDWVLYVGMINDCIL